MITILELQRESSFFSYIAFILLGLVLAVLILGYVKPRFQSTFTAILMLAFLAGGIATGIMGIVHDTDARRAAIAERSTAYAESLEKSTGVSFSVADLKKLAVSSQGTEGTTSGFLTEGPISLLVKEGEREVGGLFIASREGQTITIYRFPEAGEPVPLTK